MIVSANSNVIFGSSEEHLEGTINGLENLIILNSTFVNYYTKKLNLGEKIMINNSNVY